MSSDEIKNLRKKLKKAREGGKLQEISSHCCNLAAYLSEEEEHEEALKLYKESLSACQALGNQEGVILATRMIAEECINLGDFDEALIHVTSFLKYATDGGDKVEEQRGLVLKGHVYFTQAEFLINIKPQESKKIEKLLEQSMEAYRKSFAICNTELKGINEKERIQMKARLLQNKSLVLSRQNKLDYAQAHLTRAIKMCAKEKLNDTEHICYLSLGELYIKREEPKKALVVYEKAFELSKCIQKRRESLIGLARAHIAMNDFKQAKVVLKKAFKLRDDLEVKQLLKQVASVIRLEQNLSTLPDTDSIARKDVYKKLGDIHCCLKNYKDGIKYYLNMLSCAQKAKLDKNDLIKCYTLLCRAFTNDKQYDKALFYNHQEVESLSKWAPEKMFKTYMRIGKLHELNGSEFEEIHFSYSNAKSKAKQFENYRYQIKCLKNLIRVGNTFNKPDLVEECEKELKSLKQDDEDSVSSCGDESESDSEVSNDSDGNKEDSETDIKDLISDSDVESEEYDRPKERCKRTKFTIKRNEKGETDLHVAAIKGNYKRVKLLIDQGHPVNVRDTAGWTPLHEACNHGFVDIVNILLDFGANINDKGGPSCDGTTPLHDAATNGQLGVIETLVKRGASTLVLNDACQTPLQCLLAWKKNTALDAEEDAMFEKIIQSLKSPLDSEDIKRHLKKNQTFTEKITTESNAKKNSKSANSNTREKKFTKSEPSAVSEYKETIESLRRNRSTRPRESDESGSDNSGDDDSFGTFRKVARNKKKSASEEYREVIEELRYQRKNDHNESVKSKPKPALIDEREYVDNCIMINDDDEEENGDDEEENGDDEPEIIHEKKIESTPDSIKQRKEWGEVISFIVSPKQAKSVSSKRLSLEDEVKAKPWLKSISFDLLEDSFDSSSKEPEPSPTKIYCKQDTPTQTSYNCLDKPNSVSDKVDITVKVMNENTKISVNQSDLTKLNIEWLVREVAKQHSVLLNPDNHISCQVENNVLGELTSLAEVVNKNVELVVTKWKSLPLSIRYEKLCTISSHPDITSEVRPLGFKHSPQQQVVEILKKSSSSRCLTLSNLKLSSLTLVPICKTIMYQSFVQSLDLSNNYFGDKGIELIVKIFEKCIIEELDVSGCNVTSAGVYHFSDALSRMNEMSKNGLEVLNLSNNPITNDAVVAINNIIEQLPNLRFLDIDHCELETPITSSSSSLTIIQGNKFESPNRNPFIRNKPDS